MSEVAAGIRAYVTGPHGRLHKGEEVYVIDVFDDGYAQVFGFEYGMGTVIAVDALTPTNQERLNVTDNVNHPSHYAEGWSNGAEVIDITENLNFNRGNAVKYIARAGVKDPEKLLEDLEKAHWYIEREIQRITGWKPGEFEELWESTRPVVDLDVPAEDEFFIDHMTAPVQPRVWESLDDVPDGVSVRSRNYHRWPAASAENQRQYGPRHSGVLQVDGDGSPFTEIIEQTS